MYWTYPISTPVTIHDLDAYMFCTDHKIKINQIPVEEKEPAIDKTDIPETTRKEPTPLDKCRSRLAKVGKCQDPLFWSIYLAKFGKKEYDRVGLNGNEEMKEKMAMSDTFHKMGAAKLSKEILQKKITICGCSEMASNILTEKKLSWDSLYVVSACYDCNIYIVDLQKHTYFTYLRENPDKYDTYVLYRTRERGPEYYIDTSEQLFKLDYIRDNYVWIMGYEKPFKAAGNYKVQELEHIALILGIADDTKLKKNELYAKIALHCAL
jgi:hypothetical protein